jgi:hypothetical protein
MIAGAGNSANVAKALKVIDNNNTKPNKKLTFLHMRLPPSKNNKQQLNLTSYDLTTNMLGRTCLVNWFFTKAKHVRHYYNLLR